ncbi:hypothetical protein C2G38_2155884 [Gigaspora rosea]|uniref:Uncharacterized protein n=1 Tax=Gigaspora rosea TaxID=44941 RepID=A0A397W796_9GLOM|nr:hypothetical protein C2G38_2155884 [Gigaspora rosea]
MYPDMIFDSEEFITIQENEGLFKTLTYTSRIFLALKTFYISDNDIIDNATNPKKKPFSTVINEAHAEELLHGLIKKNTYSLTNNPYEFKLLLRGTRVVKGTDEILDDYNPIGSDKQVNLIKLSNRNYNDRVIFH